MRAEGLGSDMIGLESLQEEEETPEISVSLTEERAREDTERRWSFKSQNESSHQNSTPTAPCSWISPFYNNNEITVCCLSHTICGILYGNLRRLIHQWLLQEDRRGKRKKEIVHRMRILNGFDYPLGFLLFIKQVTITHQYFMDLSKRESTTSLDTPLEHYLAFSTLSEAFRHMVMLNVYLPPEAHSLLPQRVSASFIRQMLLLSVWPKYSCILSGFSPFSCKPNALIPVLVLMGQPFNLFP